jgi:hypothetical protein
MSHSCKSLSDDELQIILKPLSTQGIMNHDRSES